MAVPLTLPAILSYNYHSANEYYDIIKWRKFPRYWSFVQGINSPVNSPHQSQRRGALMFSLISVWTNVWVNNRDAGDLRRHCAHHDASVIYPQRYRSIAKPFDSPQQNATHVQNVWLVLKTYSNIFHYDGIQWCIYLRHHSPFIFIKGQSRVTHYLQVLLTSDD